MNHSEPPAPPSSGRSRDEGSLESVVDEQEFAKILQEPAGDFFGHAFMLGAHAGRWTKAYCSILTEKAHELETFLDDFDARNNRRFSYLAELVASARGFGATAHTLHHIRLRVPKYRLRLEVGQTEEFQARLLETHRFASVSLARLLRPRLLR